MKSRNLNLYLLTTVSLLSIVPASAHTISIGYENVGANALNFWYGTYHSNVNYTEGSFQLVKSDGTLNVTTAFTNLTGTKPAGLIDGDTNFYAGSGSTRLYPTNQYPGTVLYWQGTSFTNLQAGTYTFSYIPIANPTATWASIAPAVQTNTVTLTRADLAGSGNPQMMSGVVYTQNSPEVQTATAPVAIFNGGTLSPTADTTLAQPVSFTSAGGTIDTQGGNTTLTGDIDGRGLLTKAGANTLTITGTNTNSGGILVTGGTLAVSADTNLGTTTAPLTLNGGTLQFGGSFALNAARPVTMGSNGGTFDTNGNNGAVNNAIGGAGSLTKTGQGTLTLNGANTYAGPTTISQGTLVNNGSITGAVVNTDTFVNAGAVGGLLTNNAGTSTSTGILAGGATVNAGTLALNGGSIIGPLTIAGGTASLGSSTVDASQASVLVNGGTFEIGANSATVAGLSLVSGGVAGSGGTLTSLSDYDVRSGTVSANLGGSVGLNKTTEGTVTLSGVNTYTGASSVGAGTLLVTGSAANSAFTIANGATIGGAGTLGNLIVQGGATAAPGPVGSQLSVLNNVVFNAGSLYQVTANAAGGNSRIAAGGTATLEGGTVQVLASPGTYNLRSRYTILNAAGGLTGQFSGATSNFAFLTPTLGYDANNAYLTLTRNAVQFASVAGSLNERQAAAALQNFGLGNSLYEAVAVLSASQARTAFNALSGEIHASATTTQFSSAFLTSETILNHLRSDGEGGCGGGQNGNAGFNPSCDPNLRVPATYTADLPGRAPRIDTVPVRVIDPRVFSVWGQGFGSFGSTAGTGNTARLDRQVSGFVLGGDVRIDNTWRVGVAGGYSYASFDVPGRVSNGSVESGFGALYGSGSLGALQLRAGAVVGTDSLNTRRAVTFAGFSQNTSARYGGTTAQAFGEVGYRFAAPRSYIEPFVGGAVLRIGHDRFTETGGAASLTALGRDYDIATSTVGLRGETRIGSLIGTDLPIIARGLVGYRHAYGNVVPTTLLAFGATNPSFQTAGAPIDRDALIAQAGLDYQLSGAATLGIGYTGQVGQRAQDHGVRGSFNYRF